MVPPGKAPPVGRSGSQETCSRELPTSFGGKAAQNARRDFRVIDSSTGSARPRGRGRGHARRRGGAVAVGNHAVRDGDRRRRLGGRSAYVGRDAGRERRRGSAFAGRAGRVFGGLDSRFVVVAGGGVSGW